MTLLVTGGTGFVMSHVLLNWLRDDPGARANSVDLAPPDAMAQRFFEPGADRLEVVTGDIRDPAVLAGLAGRPIRYMVHGAAITPGVGARERARAALTVGVNVMGTVHALELARALPDLRRLIHVSTGSVYGDEGPADGAPLPEEGYVEPFPTSLYAVSKLSAELVARRFATLFELPLRMVRLSSVYGPMDRDTPGRVIKCVPNVMLHRALAGRPWTVSGATAPGDYIHGGDVGCAIVTLLRVPRLRHDVYDVAHGEAMSLAALSDTVCRIVPGAAWSTVESGADVAGNPKRITGAWGAYDTERLREDTGWAPMPLEAALADYAEWIRRHGLV